MARKKKIAGIVISLEGDATPLKRALSEVDKASEKSEKELSKINRALKFDDGNQTLLAQKFEVLEESIQQTTKRLDALKSAKVEADREFEAGNIDASAYREFIREIEKTESKLKSFQEQSTNLDIDMKMRVENKSIDEAKTALQELKDESKTLEIEQKKLTSSFGLQNAELGKNATEIDKAKLAHQQLSQKLKLSSKEIENLENQLKQSKKAYGDNSKEVKELEIKLIEAKTSFTKLNRELDANKEIFSEQAQEIKKAEKTFSDLKKEQELLSAAQKKLTSSFELQNDQMKDTNTEVEKLELSYVQVAKQLDLASKSVNNLENQLNQAKAVFSENSKEVLELETKLNGAKTTVAKFKNELNSIESRKVEIETIANLKGIDKIKNELKSLGGEAKQAGKEIGQGIAAGAATGTAALSAMAITGGDVASDLAKMNAVITNLGFDNSGGAFDKILVDSAAVTGEIDSTVEAINNLANTSLDQSQLAQTMEHLTGAAVQFSDTLKLEGLADGLQETLALGEATGSFGEYLERSSMDLDTFNEGLAQAKARGEEANYVLEVMSETGAKSFLESYKEMNSELYKYQQAQIETEIAMSRLTIALAPVLSTIANVVSAIAEWAAANPGLTKVLFVLLGAVTAVVGAIALLGPIIAGATTIAGTFGIGLAALLIPIAKVVAAIVGIIAIVALLIKAWEPLKDFFTTLWDGIVVAFKGAWDIIKRLFEGALNIFKRPINAIIELMNKFISGLNNIQIPDWVPKLGGKGLNIPQIPMLAKGTDYFRGGMAIVGEKGPELVEMPTGAKVHNNNDTMGMLGGGVVITGNNFTVREEADINRIARELYDLYEKKKRGRF